ncbi:MAG: acyltransferase family protein [Ilumatobacteraceae bacterium]
MPQQSLAHQPALDGLRAVAVALVLLFHAGLTFLPAGYLGVSMFFTLSGFLITQLLLREHAVTGTIDLGTFWSRRLRRLLPASLLCLALIVLARQLGGFAKVEGVRGDLTGAVLQVFNWVELAGDRSYGDLFGSASPVDHYWSLAIEEQFYWCWPLVLWGLLAVARRRGWSITAIVLTLTSVLSVVAVAIASAAGPDAAYWATPARLPEILVGACLACWTSKRPTVRRVPGLAPACLGVVVLLSCWWPSGSGPAYDGWLPAVAILSAGIVWGLQSPGVLRSVLSWRPVVGIGRISYGLYLFHWPVFVLLRERGWDLSSPPGLAIALGLTFAIAAVSFHVVEQPIRRATWPARATVPAAALACTGTLLVVTIAASPVEAIRADDGLLAAASIEADVSVAPLVPASSTTIAPLVPSTTVGAMSVRVTPRPTVDAAPASTTSTVPTSMSLDVMPPRPVRILVVGDSTALFVGEGLAAWSLAHPQAAQVNVIWYQGCTFLLEPEMVTFDLPRLVEDSRDTLQRRMPDAIRDLQPDVVVLMVTMSDVADRQWSAAEGPLSPFDPRYVERLSSAYHDLTDRILASGVGEVVWVVPPTPNHLWLEPAMNEADRYAIHHSVIRDVASSSGDQVAAVDLDAWLTAAGHADDPRWREDGVHLNDGSAAELAELYLGPVVVRTALGE